jgi:membrane protein required for colicin V production
MAYLDISLIGLIILFGVMGFITGFTGKVLSFLSWAIAIGISIFVFPHLQPYVRVHIENNLVADLATGGIIFLLCLIICMWISRTLAESVKKSKLGSIDRNLGALLGLGIGILILSFGLLTTRFFLAQETYTSTTEHSKIIPWLEICAHHLNTVLPKAMTFSSDLNFPSQTLGVGMIEDAAEKLATLKPKLAIEQGYAPDQRKALNQLIESVK